MLGVGEERCEVEQPPQPNPLPLCPAKASQLAGDGDPRHEGQQLGASGARFNNFTNSGSPANAVGMPAPGSGDQFDPNLEIKQENGAKV